MVGMHSVKWFDLYADVVDVTYCDVNTPEMTLRAVIAAPQTVFRVDDSGHTSRHRTRRITVAQPPNVEFKNVSNPALDAAFTIDGERWTIDLENQEGIQSSTGNYHHISIIAGVPMGRATPEVRR